MANLGGFNPDEVPPDERVSLEPVPPGIYELEVIESELVPTKSGKGDILNLTHQITSGPFANRKIWTRHNFRHENATTQQIGQREISDLCRAIGHTGVIEDSLDLHGIPYQARVGIESDKNGQYADKNVIKRFLARDGAASVQRSAPATAASRTAPAPRTASAPPPAAGNGRPGWMNRAGAAR